MNFYEHSFPSRRSVVMSRRGMAASSQPLAVEAAINVLRAGGNAIDAAVTATGVLAVVEPMSTGFGGDLFALIYQAREKRLIGLNASGRAPRAASAEALIENGLKRVPSEGPLSVTVPGFLDGITQCLNRYGTLALPQALAPAVFYAKEGFPVAEVTAQMWARSSEKLARNAESARVCLPQGRAPLPGEVFRNSDLARTLESIITDGPSLFYRGKLGKTMAEAVQSLGGPLCAEDIAMHSSNWVEPIKTSYRGYEVVEMPPNTQGLASLIALNVVEGYSLGDLEHNSVEYLHYLIEATKIALADAQAYVADPDEPLRKTDLLSKLYADRRRAEIDSTRAAGAGPEIQSDHSDTVYVAVVDEEHNVVSMISSLFKAFGSGITVPGTGLLLQNRGACFNLEPGHPNRLAPGKRPLHTIIPAMIMRDNKPWGCFGVVGGLMQAQGHLQVVCNLVDFEMNPQAALDAPRFRVLEDSKIALEHGIPEYIGQSLSSIGHSIKPDSGEEGFGGGQVILISEEALYAGSDPRKDGCALGY